MDATTESMSESLSVSERSATCEMSSDMDIFNSELLSASGLGAGTHYGGEAGFNFYWGLKIVL